jgi:YD repeat-containing protein
MLPGRRRRSTLRFVSLLTLVALLVVGLPPLPSRPGARPARAATGDAVDLLPVRLAHANGAELQWTRYTGPSGAPFDRYEVHRSATAGFTPSASTLLTTIRDRDVTRWRDTSAAPARTFYYKVVANTSPSTELAAALPAAGQTTLTLQPGTQDGKVAYMARDTTTPAGCYDWNNYGGAANLRLGTAANGVVHRPLFRFDLRDIPAKATVSAATLSLTTSYVTGTTAIPQINLHRATRDWKEGGAAYPGACNGSGANWNETRGGLRWSAGGGDLDATADATVPAKTHAVGTVDSFNVLNLVREWVNGFAPNLGMVLKLASETIGTTNPYFDYGSDDAATASTRPKLVVTFNDGSATVAPRVAMAAPSPGETVSGTQVKLSATAGDDRRVAKVEFLVGTTVVATDTATPWEATWSSTTVANGAKSLSARATDDVGNITTSSAVSVTVDNTNPPTGSMTAPAAGAVVRGTAVTLSASASDDAGVKHVEFLVDGVRVGAPDATFPYSVAWNTLHPLANLFDGTHQVTAAVTDTSGQTTVTAARTVTVDNVGASQYSARFQLNDPAVTTDDVMPQLVPDNTASTAPVQDPYAGTVNPDGTSGGSTGKTLNSAPTDSTASALAASAAATDSVASPVDTCPADAYCPTVTITNTSSVDWKNNTGLDLRVWYRWYAPNGAILFEGPANDNFPNNFQAGAVKTFPLVIQPPRLPPGAELGEYRLRIDLYDVPTATWFAAKGNPPVDNPILVAKALDDRLGLERFWQYDAEDAGAGMNTLTNVANGNMLLRWSPFFAAGRGLATMVDLTYNSLEDHSRSPAGHNFSLAVSGLTRLGEPLDIHPNKADQISGKSNKWVELIDGDGTLHRFTGTTQTDGSTRWTEPAGVNLYLRATGSADPNRAWALTRPDKVTFYYNPDGFPTAIVDRNGNTLTFTLEDTPPGEDPGGPKQRVTRVTDAGGRAFTIAYWSKAEAKKAHVRGNIKRITDHTGSALDFDYYDDGNLLRLTQRGGTEADGEFLADRSFVFTYTDPNGNAPAIPNAADRVNPDPKTPAQSTRLYSVRDPRGKESLFTYYTPTDGAHLRWKLKTRTDRDGQATGFAYNLTSRLTTVTEPLSRVTRYTYDTDGKVIQLSDPLNRNTQVAWTSDFKASKVTEPTGEFTSYTYNPNGYLTSQTNQLGDRTELTYTDQPVDAADTGNHLSLLATKTSPRGVATTVAGDYQWRFSYDTAGNLDKVTDPTSAVTDYDYNLAGSASPGTVAAVRDANGSPPSTYPSYDPSGQPTEIRDPLGNSTRLSYDPDGLLRTVQDPNHAADSGSDDRAYKTVFDYDSFHRLGRQSAPKSTGTDRGKLIWSGAEFDANDNVTRRLDPHYGSTTDDVAKAPVSTATYDAMDRPTLSSNPDTSVDPAGERTAFTYDAAGRLTKQTKPKGVLSTSVADDFTTVLAYDPLDRVIRQTDYGTSASDKRVTHRCYDLAAGDLRSITTPRAGLDQVNCPATGPLTGVGFTSQIDYDDAHRPVAQRDPLGHEQRTGYDANGNVDSRERDIATGRVSRTVTNHDQRDQPITVTQRFDGATDRNVVSRIEYDKNGNRSRVISPRANDAAGGTGTYTNYVTVYAYDAASRLTRTSLPFDSRDGAERQYVHHAYDANGNLAWTSLPVTSSDPAQVQASAKTQMAYLDPGWIRTSDEPTTPKVHFDYTAQGQQAERVPERRSAPGTLDEGKRMLWEYFDDGQLKVRKDQDGQAATYSWDANNNLTGAHSGSGLTDPGEQPSDSQVTYTGFDEVAKTRSRKQGQTAWIFSDATYDANGNVKVRRENGQEDDAGTQTKAPRRYESTYDGADWLSQQLDLGTDSGCVDDQRIVNAFWANGAEKQRDVYRAGAGCSSDPATWPKKQTTTWSHFDNGLLRDLETVNGSGTVTESHQVGYLDDGGVFVDGHRTTDRYVLKRAEGNTATTCVSASPCDAKYVYDARDRVVSHQLRAGKTNTYTLDQPANLLGDTSVRTGSVTTQTENGTTSTRKYTSGQLTEQSVGGATAKYWYDDLGNLDCVTTSAGSRADCAPSDGATVSANLVADYAYDYLNRLAGLRYFAAGARTDKTTYTYDTFDRTTKEVEDHNGTGNDRTTTFSYQGLSSQVTQEQQTGGTNPKTKSYAYDAYGHRITLTDKDNTSGTASTYSYGSDVHGSVSQLLDDAGKVKASYGYTAYGGSDTPSSDTQSLTTGDTNGQAPLNPYRYTSKRMDSGTAASTAPTVPTGSSGYDMGARRFGPDLGGFLQQDMFHGALGDLGLATDPLTQNRYALAGGNPVSFMELDGHMAIADGGGGGSASANPSTASGGSSTSSTSGGDDGGDDGGGGLLGALQKAGDWISDHKAEIVGTAVGIVAGGACLAVTGGAGSVGCAALGGAVGNAVTYGMKTPASQQSAGGYLKAAAVGGAFGAAGGVAGKALGAIGSKALQSLGSKASSALGRTSGATAGASGGRAGASTSPLGGRVSKALCNCFPAGIKVATADGAKPIQKVRVGDRVWARDLTSGKSTLRQVTGLFSKRADRIMRISVAGAVIRVTPEHPFYSPERGWIDAGHLHQGDRLLTRDGRSLTITAISRGAARTTVYNFEVEGDHNYYVSTAQLLVHNCPAGGGAGEAGGAQSATPLKDLANKVRMSGLHPAAVNERTIAVGANAEGKLFAGSSSGFDAGQRAALERLGISRVPGSSALHAEEELLRGVPDLQRIGTSLRAPCGPLEHNCLQQLIDRGVTIEP